MWHLWHPTKPELHRRDFRNVETGIISLFYRWKKLRLGEVQYCQKSHMTVVSPDLWSDSKTHPSPTNLPWKGKGRQNDVVSRVGRSWGVEKKSPEASIIWLISGHCLNHSQSVTSLTPGSPRCPGDSTWTLGKEVSSAGATAAKWLRWERTGGKVQSSKQGREPPGPVSTACATPTFFYALLCLDKQVPRPWKCCLQAT